MKKLIKVSVSLILALTIFMIGFGIYNSIKKNNTETYLRFYSDEGKGSRFNLWGLLSPIQRESQKIIRDTVRFTHKVKYPVGPNFEVVPPANDDSAENFVAKEIAQVISDSLDKIKLNLSFDYDGQAVGVRNSAKPETQKVEKPKISLSLFGTASPEAARYGFEKSLQPGNTENENAGLASSRLIRTDTAILKNLSVLGINAEITDVKSEELQLNSTAEVKDVMRDNSILDSMRYVKADVVIAIEKLKVTPVTAPIGLFFWILLGLLAFMFLKNLKIGLPLISREDLYFLLKALLFILAFLGLGLLVTSMENYIDPYNLAWAINLFGIGIVIALFAFCLWIILSNLKEFLQFLKLMFQAIIFLLSYVLDFVLLLMAIIIFIIITIIMVIIILLFKLYEGLMEFVILFKIYWGSLRLSQKILFIHIFIDLVILTAWLAGLWTINF